MTADALAVVQCLFTNIWRLFTSWNIPGTATNPATFFIFLIFSVIALNFMIKIITGGSASGVGSSFDRISNGVNGGKNE